MAKLVWDKEEDRFYENGVDHGVLYVKDTDGYAEGVAWNGLSAVTISPDGAEPNDIYADNMKYFTILSAENTNGTIEAYQSPEEFDVCDGTVKVAGMKIHQQPRKKFGFVHRSRIGTESDSTAAYKLHILYNCLAQPTEKAHNTVSESPEPETLSWEFSTTPIPIELGDGKEYEATAYIEIDSRDFVGEKATKLAALEEKLFGGVSTMPELPSPAEIYEMLK